MYLNYEILLNGYQSIYLGESIPLESLIDLKNYFEKITFVSYFTVEPKQEEINDYIKEFHDKILNKTNHEALLIGRMTEFIDPEPLPENIKIFNNIEELTHTL